MAHHLFAQQGSGAKGNIYVKDAVLSARFAPIAVGLLRGVLACCILHNCIWLWIDIELTEVEVLVAWWNGIRFRSESRDGSLCLAPLRDSCIGIIHVRILRLCR